MKAFCDTCVSTWCIKTKRRMGGQVEQWVEKQHRVSHTLRHTHTDTDTRTNTDTHKQTNVQKTNGHTPTRTHTRTHTHNKHTFWHCIGNAEELPVQIKRVPPTRQGHRGGRVYVRTEHLQRSRSSNKRCSQRSRQPRRRLKKKVKKKKR